jgi:hypothetical protein
MNMLTPLCDFVLVLARTVVMVRRLEVMSDIFG